MYCCVWPVMFNIIKNYCDSYKFRKRLIKERELPFF